MVWGRKSYAQFTGSEKSEGLKSSWGMQAAGYRPGLASARRVLVWRTGGMVMAPTTRSLTGPAVLMLTHQYSLGILLNAHMSQHHAPIHPSTHLPVHLLTEKAISASESHLMSVINRQLFSYLPLVRFKGQASNQGHICGSHTLLNTMPTHRTFHLYVY